MPEIGLAPLPAKPDLRVALEAKLQGLQPPLRAIASEVFGDEGTIDIVALAPDGEVVLLLIGDEGEDRALLTEAVAQRIWLQKRLDHWRQLAPELGLRIDRPVRIALFSPSYASQTRAVADDESVTGIELFSVRAITCDGIVELLVESITRSTRREPQVELTTHTRLPHPQPASLQSAPTTAMFRCGLSESELGLSPEERREFDRAPLRDAR